MPGNLLQSCVADNGNNAAHACRRALFLLDLERLEFGGVCGMGATAQLGVVVADAARVVEQRPQGDPPADVGRHQARQVAADCSLLTIWKKAKKTIPPAAALNMWRKIKTLSRAKCVP